MRQLKREGANAARRGRPGANAPRGGRPWSLPLADRVLLPFTDQSN